MIEEELRHYIKKYVQEEILDPYKPDCWELKEFIEKEANKIPNKNDMGTSTICWIATRIYNKDPQYVCNYANHEVLEILDKTAFSWLKKK